MQATVKKVIYNRYRPVNFNLNNCDEKTDLGKPTNHNRFKYFIGKEDLGRILI